MRTFLCSAGPFMFDRLWNISIMPVGYVQEQCVGQWF